MTQARARGAPCGREKLRRTDRRRGQGALRREGGRQEQGGVRGAFAGATVSGGEVGPEASRPHGMHGVGKTEWALRWAEANSAEIISCDSLLFYRGMDIGTAKPSSADLRRVRHHLIDVRAVTEPMNAAIYAAMARAAAEEIHAGAFGAGCGRERVLPEVLLRARCRRP